MTGSFWGWERSEGSIRIVKTGLIKLFIMSTLFGYVYYRICYFGHPSISACIGLMGGHKDVDIVI